MDTKKSNTGWSDQELEASVDGYLKMLKLESLGQPLNKKAEHELLRESALGARSLASVDYRMRNISAVFETLNHTPIAGYTAANNVGSGILSRIRRMLEQRGIVEYQDNAPTSDEALLERRAAKLQSKPIKTKPGGITTPQQVSTTSTSYVRDPEVRAWVRQQAAGICEGCGLHAPFNLDNGQPFLEVHHVKHLAQKGSDRTSNAVALCPNCHQRCHRSSDREAFTAALYSKIERLIRE
ncbi:HNH endonuclease [Pseudomonas tolaasii]|uniref:HNH endonuclease n=1 Tax=Pseudomonas tolaasii TaxID=29442 RepID=UPI0015A15C93|nr:HNH endonuclease signature motif containing protein [Pseudomonas tolaasii]NWC27847.1 HNH endonuclease [Pseudomonas tolaasii]NWC52152.1 HNH endonuclease [Pseudomonas tolaasii]NWE65933.1 HNH endonuclease [Pseudomonas tolaasii]